MTMTRDDIRAGLQMYVQGHQTSFPASACAAEDLLLPFLHEHQALVACPREHTDLAWDQEPGELRYWLYCRYCATQGPVASDLIRAALCWNRAMETGCQQGIPQVSGWYNVWWHEDAVQPARVYVTAQESDHVFWSLDTTSSATWLDPAVPEDWQACWTLVHVL